MARNETALTQRQIQVLADQIPASQLTFFARTCLNLNDTTIQNAPNLVPVTMYDLAYNLLYHWSGSQSHKCTVRDMKDKIDVGEKREIIKNGARLREALMHNCDADVLDSKLISQLAVKFDEDALRGFAVGVLGYEFNEVMTFMRPRDNDLSATAEGYIRAWVKNTSNPTLGAFCQILQQATQDGLWVETDIEGLQTELSSPKYYEPVDYDRKPTLAKIYSEEIGNKLRGRYLNDYTHIRTVCWSTNDSQVLEMDRYFIDRKLSKKSSQGSSKLIEIKDLFRMETSTRKSARRIFIEGAVGAGKSTLCHKLALDWSAEDKRDTIKGLRDFKAVFLIKVAEVLHTESLIEYIQRKLLPEQTRMSQDGLEEIMHAKVSTLFILDGLDDVTDEMEGILALVNGKQYDWATIVATTRHGLAGGIKCRFDLLLQISKLTVEDIDGYIVKHEGLTLDGNNSALHDILSTPLLLSMYCRVSSPYAHDAHNITKFLNLLTDQMREKLCRERCDGQRNEPAKCEAALNTMSRHAYESLKYGSCKFQGKLTDLEERIGFVEVVDTNISDRGYKSYAFTHKMLQEYLCAKYLCSFSELDEIIDSFQRMDETRFLSKISQSMLPVFLCGLMSEKLSKEKLLNLMHRIIPVTTYAHDQHAEHSSHLVLKCLSQVNKILQIETDRYRNFPKKLDLDLSVCDSDCLQGAWQLIKGYRAVGDVVVDISIQSYNCQISDTCEVVLKNIVRTAKGNILAIQEDNELLKFLGESGIHDRIELERLNLFECNLSPDDDMSRIQTSTLQLFNCGLENTNNFLALCGHAVKELYIGDEPPLGVANCEEMLKIVKSHAAQLTQLILYKLELETQQKMTHADNLLKLSSLAINTCNSKAAAWFTNHCDLQDGGLSLDGIKLTEVDLQMILSSRGLHQVNVLELTNLSFSHEGINSFPSSARILHLSTLLMDGCSMPVVCTVLQHCSSIAAMSIRDTLCTQQQLVDAFAVIRDMDIVQEMEFVKVDLDKKPPRMPSLLPTVHRMHVEQTNPCMTTTLTDMCAANAKQIHELTYEELELSETIQDKLFSIFGQIKNLGLMKLANHPDVLTNMSKSSKARALVELSTSCSSVREAEAFAEVMAAVEKLQVLSIYNYGLYDLDGTHDTVDGIICKALCTSHTGAQLHGVYTYGVSPACLIRQLKKLSSEEARNFAWQEVEMCDIDEDQLDEESHHLISDMLPCMQ